MQPLHLTRDELVKNIDEQVNTATREFRAGFEFIQKYPKRVTFFGSARALPESVHYQQAEDLANRVAKELGYVVVTGAGPGIMQAANKGAREARVKTIGIAIGLPREQRINEFVDDVVCFEHFYARKTMLTFAPKAYVFFPGGYGTFDELFSILTLVQNRKIPSVPIILVGADFWKPLETYMTTNMYESHATISKNDLDLFTITDSIEEAFTMIKDAPAADWWTDAD